MNKEQSFRQLMNFINSINLPEKKNIKTYIVELQNNSELLNQFLITILSVSNHLQVRLARHY